MYWKGLFLKKAKNEHKIWYTKDVETQIHNYFRTNKRQDIVDLLIVLADVGARIGKVLPMHINQINFKERTISIIDDKNNKDYVLPLTNRAYEVFLKYRHKAVPFDHLTHNAVRLSWNRMRKKFGWPSRAGYKIHALRHTCGTRLSQAGVEVKVIQEWLNHSDIRQTSRYIHTTLKQLEDARDKLEGLL